MKKQKGITLIALIISIIVLLILAVVTIGTVKDSGIIDHAENAKNSYIIAQEKEQIGLAVSEYQLEKTISGTNPIFKDIIITALQGQVDKVEGDNEGPLTIKFKSENIYTVTQDGEITSGIVSGTVSIWQDESLNRHLTTGNAQIGETYYASSITFDGTTTGMSFTIFEDGSLGYVRSASKDTSVTIPYEVSQGAINDGYASVGSDYVSFPDESGNILKFVFDTDRTVVVYINGTEVGKLSLDDELPIWQVRELKTENAQIGQLYYSKNIQYYYNDTICTGLTFGLYDNGDVCANYNADKIAVGSLGKGGIPSATVNNYLNNGAWVSNDMITFTAGKNSWITVKFTSSTDASVYSAILDLANLAETDGKKHVPLTSEYYKGIITTKDEPVIGEVVHSGVVPEGGTYYVGVTSVKLGDYTGATATYNAGDTFPTTVSVGDVYVYGDYEYRYQLHYDIPEKNAEWTTSNTNGWGVKVLDTTKSSYESIINQINNENVTSLVRTFKDCTAMTQAPSIPTSTVNMKYAFSDTLIETAIVPDNVETLERTFASCDNITTITINSSKVTDVYGILKDSTSEKVTIYVPENSTTYSTLSDYVTNVNLESNMEIETF